MGVTIYPPTGGPTKKPMLVKIIRQTVALKRTVRVGEVIEVEASEGRILLTGNKAVEVTADMLQAAEKPRAKGAKKAPAGATGATGAAAGAEAAGATGAPAESQPGATGAAQSE